MPIDINVGIVLVVRYGKRVETWDFDLKLPDKALLQSWLGLRNTRSTGRLGRLISILKGEGGEGAESFYVVISFLKLHHAC